MVFQGVSQMEPRFQPVTILAPHALPFEVAPPFKIDHDPLYGPFCDLYHHRNVSNADIGPERDAIEDVRMVAEKRPVMGLYLVRHVAHFSCFPKAAGPLASSATRFVTNSNSRKPFHDSVLR